MTEVFELRNDEAAETEDLQDGGSLEFLSTYNSEETCLLSRSEDNENVLTMDEYSTDDETDPAKEPAESKPCLNNSRKKLLLLWAPPQLCAIGLVAWSSSKVFNMEMADELEGSLNVYYSAMAIQCYFVFIVMRDTFFLLTHLQSDSLMGFWDAIYKHLIALPADCAILLLLINYAMYKMSQQETEEHCHLLEWDCGEVAHTVRLNIALGIVYIYFNITIKFLIACLFMFCLGGVEMFKDDLEAQERSLQHLQGLPEVSFASVSKGLQEEGFAAMRECIICLVKYRGNDAVTQLKCHPSHFFHSNCLQMALSKKHECPICRYQIL